MTISEEDVKMAKQITKKPEVINQAAIQEVINQAATPEVDNSVNVLDIVLDGWLNSVKLAQVYKREIEGMTFKAIEHQKDIWVQSRENVEKVDNEINKFTDYAKSYFLANLKSLNGGSISENVKECNNQVEDITNHLKQLFGTPGNTSNLLGRSLDQMESIFKTIIQQQQNNRDEIQVLLENFISQVKTTNKVIMETWESNRRSICI
jgi:prophage DNA circulation protein